MKRATHMMTSLNTTTGQLDRSISEMKVWAKRAEDGHLDEADVQTLKHHAEDMVAMGDYVIRKLERDYREQPGSVTAIPKGANLIDMPQDSG